MKTPLDDKQKAAIDGLRKKGKSIKAIAKAIHVSDKRVSAYLKGRKSECSCHGKGSAQKNKKDPFGEMVKMSINNFGESVSECAAIIDETVLGCLHEILEDISSNKKTSKKNLQRHIHKRLDCLFTGLSSAMHDAAVAMIFNMPSKMKKLWVDSINRDPREVWKKGKK